MKLIVPEFHPLSFFFPERLYCCYIDFHCSYLYSYYNSFRTLCIKCWVRTEFQHFILRFNKISLLYTNTTKRGVRGWKEAQRQGDFTDFSNIWYNYWMYGKFPAAFSAPLQDWSEHPGSKSNLTILKLRRSWDALTGHLPRTWGAHPQNGNAHRK